MRQIGVAGGEGRNRDLVAGLLPDHEVVEIGDAALEEMDLCIVDERELASVRAQLDAWRAAQHPSFAPVLLLARSEGTNPWDRYAEELSDRIDAITRIPAPKAALAARIENLLEMRDVSRELTAEHQLNERIFETSPLAKLVLDTEGTVVRANERVADVLGLSPADIVGLHYESLSWLDPERAWGAGRTGKTDPDDGNPVVRVLETGSPVYDHEASVERPDGARVWLSVNAAPILNERDEVEYAVVALDDVTVRRRQERELERQLDLFEKAQDIANTGAWEYNVVSGESYWTEEVYRIHGLSPDVDASPERSLQHYHPEDRPVVRDAFERALEEGEPYDLEARLIDADGTQRWVRTRGEPQFEADEPRHIRGTLQDVTDRKGRELELQRMTRAVDEAPIGITLSDPSREDNPLTYVNDGFVEQTGYPREEAIGRNCRFLQGERTDPGAVAEIRAAIDAEEPISKVIRNYRRDGTEFWNRLEIAPIHDEDGTLINFIGFQQDVTERVERRRQIQKLDQYLRHNLRNEMNVVGGLAEQIEVEGGAVTAEAAARILAHADSLMAEMEKEREIVRVLREDPIVEPVELSALLRSLGEQVRSSHPEAELSVSAPDAVTARATPRLRVALEELLVNAITHNGGETPWVEVSATVEGDDVVVRIADDGPGIPEIEREVLAGSTEETQLSHGQGLGLWLVYLIVRRSGGRIEFSANEPRGSVVRVVLSVDGTGRAAESAWEPVPDSGTVDDRG